MIINLRAMSLALAASSAAVPAKAQDMPALLANLPASQSDAIQRALSERVRSSFPRDIRTSTLTALLEMDGFAVTAREDGYEAGFMRTEFPCITDYVLTWHDGPTGRVAGLELSIRQKCV